MIRGINRTDTKISRAAAFFAREKESLRQEFEEAALPHLNHIYRAAYYLTRNDAEANDLVQDTYLNAYRSFHQFRPGTNCRAWLLTILRNLFLNAYDRKRRQPEMVDWERIDDGYESIIAGNEQHDEKSNPETILFSQVTARQIAQAVRELPEEYRTAIILVDIEELTYGEAAKLMDCPLGTIRSRLSRGRRLLQVGLRDVLSPEALVKP